MEFYSLILKRIDALRLLVQKGDTRPMKSYDLKINEDEDDNIKSLSEERQEQI